jgi:hypothetical protein
MGPATVSLGCRPSIIVSPNQRRHLYTKRTSRHHIAPRVRMRDEKLGDMPFSHSLPRPPPEEHFSFHEPFNERLPQEVVICLVNELGVREKINKRIYSQFLKLLGRVINCTKLRKEYFSFRAKEAKHFREIVNEYDFIDLLDWIIIRIWELDKNLKSNPERRIVRKFRREFIRASIETLEQNGSFLILELSAP